MFTIVIFFLVLSILVIIHECGHFFAAKLNGIKVEEFGFGLPPRIVGIKFGETLYSLNALPFGGFVKVFGEEAAQLDNASQSSYDKNRAFIHKKNWQKVVVLIAGVVCNFLLGWLIISYLFTKGVPVPSDKVTIEEVVASSPAAASGLKKNDVILSFSVDSIEFPVKKSEDVTGFAKKYAGREVVRITTQLIPRLNPPKGQGALGIVVTNFSIKKYSVLEAPVLGLVEASRMTYLIFTELAKTLFRFITFQKPEADIAGPIGIAQLTSAAAKQGLDALLQMIGLLSLNLAVINILPFPALDGGRLMLVFYEVVTRRKVNPQIERKLNIAGFAILLSLIVLVTINDIIKLFH